MCALAKKPKIPIEVININNTTAIVKYVLSKNGAVFQLRYNQEAVTNLANSMEDAIKTTGQKAPIKMAAKPIIE
jgi:phosphotransferase system IIB component